jgi:two-component system sensor histidine kinase PhoQ
VAALTKVYGHVPVTISLSGRDVDFFGDENDLMEIAGNLLDNACKYGAGLVKVTVTEHASGWQLMVEDNGPGIVTEQRQRILQRGVRLDSMVSGQGIGLALVSDLVSQHNGSISITDSELGGACFTVILPGSEDGREPSDGEKNE